MAETTIKLSNTNKPAPRWFRKLKNASGYLIDGAIIIMLASGTHADSFWMLISRIGYSRVMAAIEALIANGDDYVSNQVDLPVNQLENKN